MEQSMGALKAAPEATFPDRSVDSGGTLASDTRLQLTSNMGLQNALSIDLSAFRVAPTDGVAGVGQLPFTSTEEANGEGATADFIVYDSLGTPINVRVTTVLESIDSTGARFRWIATSPQNAEDSG